MFELLKKVNVFFCICVFFFTKAFRQNWLLLMISIFFFFSETNVYGITVVTVGTGSLIVVLAIFLDTLRYIMKNSSSRVKAHSAFVIGVYPVSSNTHLLLSLLSKEFSFYCIIWNILALRHIRLALLHKSIPKVYTRFLIHE